MKDFRVGDKFKRNFVTYVMCSIDGYYYLVNVDSGGNWTNGLEHNEMISELNEEGFEKIK